MINYCGVGWIRGGGTACSSSSSGCVDLGSYAKAALFLKCFPEKARTRANIIRAGTNFIFFISIHCNSFYSIPVQCFSIPSIITTGCAAILPTFCEISDAQFLFIEFQFNSKSLNSNSIKKSFLISINFVPNL